MSEPARRSKGPVPLVIGVTGHRHLNRADYPLYERHIADFLTQLQVRYPATPLKMISALAEGADRLAAQVALAQGCELLVPLPLAAAEYEQDFPDSVAEFRTLLARTSEQNVFVLPQRHEGHGGLGAREAHYRASGVYVAGHCHILLALWDGVQNDAVAGTAEIVRLKLEGRVHPDLRVLSADEGGPVYCIFAPRAGESARADLPGRWMFPEGASPELFHTVCRRIERFNRDALRTAPAPDAAGQLLENLAARPAGDRQLAAAFACADALARRFQRLTHTVLRTIIALAVALALTFEVYAEIMSRRELPILYLLIFSAIAAIYLWQRRFDAQGRYLDYRALAEGLRVQFYWRLAGLSDSAAGSYLRKQLDELRWIREALRGASVLPPPSEPRADLVVEHWVRGQAHYFRARAAQQLARIRRVERASEISLALGLSATLTLVLLWNRLERLGHWRHWLVLVMGFAPIAAALWEAYGERFGLRTQAHQYARFATIFDRAEKSITPELAAGAGAPHGLLPLIRELGREALMESGDWVLLLRERPIALPKG